MVHAALGAVLTVMLAALPGLTGDVREASATESCYCEGCSGDVVQEGAPKARAIETPSRGNSVPLKCRIVALLPRPKNQDAAALYFDYIWDIPAPTDHQQSPHMDTRAPLGSPWLLLVRVRLVGPIRL